MLNASKLPLMFVVGLFAFWAGLLLLYHNPMILG